MSNAPAKIRDLEVAYGTNVVLHGISATIERGQCVAVTGSNGSGKSTFIKALLGIAPVIRGEVLVFGKGTRGSIPWNKVGYVPQRASAGGGVSATVSEIVETGLLGPRQLWRPRGAAAKISAALAEVGLTHRADDAIGVLSGGQQQRALIARAMVRSPELLLLDEPLTGLDEHNRKALAEILGDFKEGGGTSIIVLHELGELGPLIDRELQISSGHLVHDGPCTHASHGFVPHHHSPEPKPSGFSMPEPITGPIQIASENTPGEAER